jgi:hypothetical protein
MKTKCPHDSFTYMSAVSISALFTHIYPEDGGSTLFRNVGDYLPVDKAFRFQKAWNFKTRVD